MSSGENAPRRQFHTANIYKEKMWVFGGGDGESWLNVLNVYDLGRDFSYKEFFCLIEKRIRHGVYVKLTENSQVNYIKDESY